MRRAALSLAIVVLGVTRVTAMDGADLPGSRVRLQVAGADRVIGVVVGVDEESITVRTRPDAGVTIVPRRHVVGIEVSRGVRRHTVRGLVGGALAWVTVAGLYAAFDTLDESGVGEPLFIGGVVAGGGLVGTLTRTERWERASASGLSMRVSPRRRGLQVDVVLAF